MKVPEEEEADMMNCCYNYYTLFLPRGKVRPADKLQLKAATVLLVGLARSKQDPINRGHHDEYRRQNTVNHASSFESALSCKYQQHCS